MMLNQSGFFFEPLLEEVEPPKRPTPSGQAITQLETDCVSKKQFVSGFLVSKNPLKNKSFQHATY
jgi:hypothetical protein